MVWNWLFSFELLRKFRFSFGMQITVTFGSVNNGRNLVLNKIQFSHLHYILQYRFWFGFESGKLQSLYWYLEKTQGHSMRSTAMITICKYYIKPVSIYCVLLNVSENKVSGWSLKCSIAQLDRQNRKFAPILIITEV